MKKITGRGRELEARIIRMMQRRIKDKEPCDMPILSAKLKVEDSRLHGRQHFVSRAIMSLRRQGIIEDVADRCPHCHRAARDFKTVPLFLTQLGQSLTQWPVRKETT